MSNTNKKRNDVLGRRVIASAMLVSIMALIALANFPAYAEKIITDKMKELIRSRGYIEVTIAEAKVPDMDPLPMQGDSDVFVRIYLNDTRDILCETPIIQDENKPKFDKTCKIMRLVSADTIVRMEILDSDRPAPEPDLIGTTRVRVSDLILNDELTFKKTLPIEGRQWPKYYLKASIDFKPEK